LSVYSLPNEADETPATYTEVRDARPVPMVASGLYCFAALNSGAKPGPKIEHRMAASSADHSNLRSARGSSSRACEQLESPDAAQERPRKGRERPRTWPKSLVGPLGVAQRHLSQLPRHGLLLGPCRPDLAPLRFLTSPRRSPISAPASVCLPPAAISPIGADPCEQLNEQYGDGSGTHSIAEDCEGGRRRPGTRSDDCPSI
jgi:hypothetical protein